jgi:hypothetical protein
MNEPGVGPTVEDLLQHAQQLLQDEGSGNWAAQARIHVEEALYWCSERPVEGTAEEGEPE